MRDAHAPADPGAATEAPHAERAATPRPRGWMRSARDSVRVQLHPQIAAAVDEALNEIDELELLPDGTVPPVRLAEPREPDVAAAVAAVVEPLEEADTDHGAPPVPVEDRPYVNLEYEERVCRLLEDIRENTRRTHLHLSAEEHRRREAEKGHLVTDDAEEPRRLRRWFDHWCLDEQVKAHVVRALAVGVSLGSSVVASGSTMALAMELVERLLRAWVSLP